MRRVGYIVALVAMMAFTSCSTHNNGDIGIWFGTWAVDAATVNGQEFQLDPYVKDPAYFMQFQTSVVCLRYTNAARDGGESYGVWRENDNTLTIDFPDDNNRDVFLPGLGAHNVLTITSRQSNCLTLQQVDDQGNVFVYRLRKLK